jgi:hypothetical protein
MIESYDGAIVSQQNPVQETARWLVENKLPDIRRRGRAQATRVRADYNWELCAEALAVALDACVAGRRSPLAS